MELNQERQDKEKHSVTHALRARQTSATDTPKQDMDPENQNMGRKKLKSAGPGSESGKWQQADVSDKRRQENITKVKQAHKGANRQVGHNGPHSSVHTMERSIGMTYCNV